TPLGEGIWFMVAHTQQLVWRPDQQMKPVRLRLQLRHPAGTLPPSQSSFPTSGQSGKAVEAAYVGSSAAENRWAAWQSGRPWTAHRSSRISSHVRRRECPAVLMVELQDVLAASARRGCMAHHPTQVIGHALDNGQAQAGLVAGVVMSTCRPIGGT